jgi:hypothetical protein
MSDPIQFHTPQPAPAPAEVVKPVAAEPTKKVTKPAKADKYKPYKLGQ